MKKNPIKYESGPGMYFQITGRKNNEALIYLQQYARNDSIFNYGFT